MKLKEWLEKNNVSQQEFAEHLGKSKSAICRYLNGSRTPNVETIVAISTITEEQVTVNDWM